VTDNDRIPEPTELIYSPRPSWGPVFFALGAAAAVCGIYAEGFMLRGWVYSLVGIVVLLCAIVAITHRATRDFFRLPRKQRVRGGVLPVETIKPLE
jgi:hypothetical protein